MRYFLILIQLLAFTIGSAQTVTVSGYIFDAETGERLIGANIYDTTSKKGSVSNDYGFYSLSMPESQETILMISYLGYTTVKEKIFPTENQKSDFVLLSENFLLDGVVLTATKEIPIEKRNEIGVLTIPVEQIEMLPALGGEVDVLKALQLMPGVQSGNEGSSGLYVRGGSPDQNLVLLDDVPMYYVNHLGGFVSTFNIDAISNVKLIKGGFPAQYGGRLSSILNIRMKDGNMKKFEGSGMIGMVAAKLALQGPIKKDTTSYMISARRMLYDLLTRPISKIAFDGVSLGYTFYDFNAKINHKFSDTDRLYFSTYLGNDRSTIRKKGDDAFKNTLAWGNNLAALRWNHVYGQKLFSNATLSYTRYRFETSTEGEFTNNGEKFESSRKFLSGIYDFGAKIDFEYFASSRYKFKFGGNSIYHTFKPGATTNRQSTNGQRTLDNTVGSTDTFAWENAAYLENEIRIGDRINTNLGFRGAVYHVNGTDYVSLEPRVLASYLVSKNMSIKAAYSRMQQNVHLLTNTGVGMPTDLWVPATDEVAPQTSQQWSLGVAKSVKDGIYEFSAEAYYKNMKNLIEYKEGASFLGTTTNWEDLVESDGEGTSYGLELLLQKKEGRTTGWVGYTWSKTDRQFEDINGGKKFPYRYDRRHDASIVVAHQLNKKVDVSATWVYGTGAAFTLPIGKYDIIDESEDYFGSEGFSEVYIYGERNASRMRAFHKLDVGVNFRKKKKWGERTLNISIYNLYNRQNPYFYFVDGEEKRDAEGNFAGYENNFLSQQSLFPILPSISYSFRF
ncbi:TonB-dependent receptor [hydrothermal vent metagenome]|uniref:TonB-dependent receptor n=1 Tax=hydrothermal vent metagenome TaxID=652676 RepID=A0A3B0U5M4_9ZZZZ